MQTNKNKKTLKLLTKFNLKYKRWNRKFNLSKRQQFVLITIILTFGLLLTQMVGPEYRYTMVAILSGLTYSLFAFGLRDDLAGIEWITLLILPTLFTASISVFYFLLPVRWLTRIPFVVLYALGIYALTLTENIYNIAAIRTIALLRAAHSVGFLLTLVTFFLLSHTILSQRLLFVYNGLLVGVVGFLLMFQFLWSVLLENNIIRKLLILSLIITIVLIEMLWVLSFWPTNITIIVLFITTCFYALAAIAQQYLLSKLYRKTLYEFSIVVLIVFFILFVSTNWYGN